MLDVGHWFVAEVCSGHSCGHKDRCQAPQDDDSKETGHGEDNEGVADLGDGADELDDGEQEEHAQAPHSDGPQELINTLNADIDKYRPRPMRQLRIKKLFCYLEIMSSMLLSMAISPSETLFNSSSECEVLNLNHHN